jgi:hypothetical protein
MPLIGEPLWSTIRIVVDGDEKSRGLERHPPVSNNPPANITKMQLERFNLASNCIKRKQPNEKS